MKLTTATAARSVALALALAALGVTVAASADPPPGGGGAPTTGATTTTNSSSSNSSSSSSSSSNSTSTSSGGSSTCETRVVVQVDGRVRERTERSSGPSCSTRVEIHDRKVQFSGSAAAEGDLTAAKARRLTRSVLEEALGKPVRGRIRCADDGPRRHRCTVAGRRGTLARLAIRRHGSGDDARLSWRGEIERP